MMRIHVAARPAVPTTPAAMQRKPVGLTVEAVLVIALIIRLRLRLRLSTAGDECRQAGIAAALGSRLLYVRLRPPAAVGLLTRRIRLLIAMVRLGFSRLIGLRLAAIGHVAHRVSRRVVVAPIEALVAALLRLVAEVWVVLPELFLRCGDQPEVMLRVLEVVLRRHRVAGRRGVTRQLDIFLGNMIGGPADFHVGTV